MPKLAQEISKTELDRLLNGASRIKGTKRIKQEVVALGNPRGFCIRLAPGKQSSASCYLTYRLDKNGVVKWLPLGVYPDLSLEELREKARLALKLKGAGKDPHAEKEDDFRKRREETEATKAAKTIKDACDLYLEHAADRSRVKQSTEVWATGIIANQILPTLGQFRVADIRRQDVKDWHRSPTLRKTPAAADAALRVLSKIFNLAIEKDWRSDNPAFKIEKLINTKARERKRIMDKDERKALFRALRSMKAEGAIEPEPLGAIRALAVSAMRLQEVLTLRWDEVNFKTRLITKKDHKTSSEVGPKQLAITPELEQILKSQCNEKGKPLRKGSPWVFPSPWVPKEGEEIGHFVGLQRVWDRVKARVTVDEAELVKAGKKPEDEAVNIEDVHLHDLRRTALSVTAGEQNIKIISAVAGHANTATTEKVYALINQEKMRVGAELIAAAIAKDMEEEVEQDGSI